MYLKESDVSTSTRIAVLKLGIG